MDLGQPIRKLTVVPLRNPVPARAPEPERREIREPAKEPEKTPA
jgi:hypothetical protein